MTTATIDYRQTVNRLIEICHDGELGFAAASNAMAADEPLLKAELLQYSWQRREFALELERELEKLGEKPATHGTVSGAIHRSWMNLKQAVAAHSRHVILSECERGEEAALAAYQEAALADSLLPKPLADLIESQYHAVRRISERLSALREASKPS
jgi:uncharacterized protein (TIGR02284 family)